MWRGDLPAPSKRRRGQAQSGSPRPAREIYEALTRVRATRPLNGLATPLKNVSQDMRLRRLRRQAKPHMVASNSSVPDSSISQDHRRVHANLMEDIVLDGLQRYAFRAFWKAPDRGYRSWGSRCWAGDGTREIAGRPTDGRRGFAVAAAMAACR